jgi:hypothetical protein
MFRICLGGSEQQQQHSQQNNAVFEPVGNEESKREVLQVPTKTKTKTTAEPKNTTTRTLVLLEIVGAMGLAFVAGQQEQQNQQSKNNPLAFLEHDTMNPYCVVQVAGKQVHRTSEIEHDTSPIWTLQTKSVCLLELEELEAVVTVELWQRRYNMIGQVQLTFQQLVSGKGERVEFSIVPDQPAVHLALRFRPATRRDVLFFQHQHEHVPAAHHTRTRTSKQTDHYLWNTTTTTTTSASAGHHAADVEFKNVVSKSLLKKNETKVFVLDPTSSTNNDNDNKKRRTQKAFRVWPFPDPDRPKETTEFMTKQQLKDEALLPSKQWVEGGYGHFGTVHLEVLGCDNLPNMVCKQATTATVRTVWLILEQVATACRLRTYGTDGRLDSLSCWFYFVNLVYVCTCTWVWVCCFHVM